MDFIDYYQLLEVSKAATEEEIKKSFRRLARKYHPDLHPDDKDAKKKFQQINEAYEVLRDPEKRSQYDKYGENWKHGEAFEKAQQQNQYADAGGQGGFSNDFGDSGQFQEGADFSDFFESLFGHKASRSQHTGRKEPFKGQDFHAELTLTLQQASVTHQQILTVNGKKVRITIPAGIANGQKIKLNGYGASGYGGGQPGDLFLTFNIDPDKRYQRKGDDIYMVEPLPLYIAILGGEKEIETLNGKVRVNIKPLTQNETSVRLKEKGFPVYKKENEFGDLFIKWKVDLPKHLSEKEKELFQQLADNH